MRSRSSASASWGTHFGCTMLVVSTTVCPASTSRSTNSALTSTGSTVDSFCNPSRGPTSQIVTRGGSGSPSKGVTPKSTVTASQRSCAVVASCERPRAANPGDRPGLHNMSAQWT